MTLSRFKPLYIIVSVFTVARRKTGEIQSQTEHHRRGVTDRRTFAPTLGGQHLPMIVSALPEPGEHAAPSVPPTEYVGPTPEDIKPHIPQVTGQLIRLGTVKPHIINNPPARRGSGAVSESRAGCRRLRGSPS